MAVSSETAWPSVMVKRGTSVMVGGTDSHGNCSHVMFHFQLQASSFCWGIPLQQGFNLEWPNQHYVREDYGYILTINLYIWQCGSRKPLEITNTCVYITSGLCMFIQYA